MNCPVCKSVDVAEFLLIRNIPTTQNLLYKTREEALAALIGDVDLRMCKNCSFIYNHAFIEEKVVYSADYDNNQSYSDVFKDYISKQIDWLIENYIKKDDVIAEIGCGKGYYIFELLEKAASKKVKCGYGFDSTYTGAESVDSINLKYFRNYYSERYKYINPNVVILRHVIEHISNPIEFFKPIYESLNENTILFIETPNVDWILKNNIIYDFFYEHCSYYNQSSIAKLLEQIGFKILEIKDDFGGQYMWVVAVVKKTQTKQMFAGGGASNSNYLYNRKLFEENIKKELDNLYSNGINTALWGAGAKGITFVNLFDKKNNFIRCLIDINEDKKNKYVANTGHIVIPPSDISKYGIGKIFIMNANYSCEINGELHRLNLKNIDVEVL